MKVIADRGASSSLRVDVGKNHLEFAKDSAKAIVGASPIVFGPCTLGRTWGTRPISVGVF
jgi:hypothetical protein